MSDGYFRIQSGILGRRRRLWSGDLTSPLDPVILLAMAAPEPPLSRIDASGLGVALLCCLFWGGNAVAAKLTVSPAHLPPIGASGFRFLLSLPVVAWVGYKVGASVRVAWRDWWLIGVHGCLAAIQIGSFNWGTSLSEAGRSSVFINIHPLVVAPLAWLLLGERLGLRGVLGLASAAVGVAILLAKPILAGGGSGLTGDLIVLGSGVVFGLQTIAQKKTFPIIPPTTLLLLQSMVAIPLSFGFSFLVEGPTRYHFNPTALAGIFYQGFVVSGLTFSLWMILLRRYYAGQLAAVSFMTPLFGIALGTLIRHEPITPPLMIGSAAVGLGIYLAATDRGK